MTPQEIEKEAARLFAELKNVSMRPGQKWTLEDCLSAAPYTLEINRLKQEKDAYILAHTYVPPELMYGASDFISDSYALSVKAAQVTQQTIIFAGVWFMAETAKIINPSKTVLIPAGHAGCTLADSMTGQDLVNFKQQHPGVPVLCYINSSAEVKAHSDVCVTSANVYDIAAAMPGDKLIFVPDMLMAQNVQKELKRRGINKEILYTGGSCCVHDKYTENHVKTLRDSHPGIKILIHPEARPEVCALCDYVGGTSGMVKYLQDSKEKTFGMLTEYGFVNRMEHDHPQKEFIWPFGTCSYMKRNSLISTLTALKEPSKTQIVEVDAQIAAAAKRCIDKMFEMTKEIKK